MSQESGSVAIVVPSEGRACFGRVASVVRQDFERPRRKRLRLVSGTQSPELAGPQFVSRVEDHGASAAPFVRRVALVPGSKICLDPATGTRCWQIRTMSVSRLAH